MPELPEVHTVVTILKPLITGQKIIDIKIFWTNLLRQEITVSDFKKKLINQTFLDVKRQGKHIIFYLSDLILLNHLRMEGQFYLTDDLSNINHHVLLIFKLSNQKYLCYHDTRRFGTFLIRSYDNFQTVKPLCDLGIEPFDPKFDYHYLKNCWQKIKSPIKTVLLNQKYIAGIGNIYANEILFYSHINPFTPACKLTDQQLKSIVTNSIIVLNKAINLGGTSISTFKINNHITGKFQNELLVHQRENQHCFDCNSKIKRVKINQRSCFYCETCQK